jgi:hypothetical protein
MFSQNNTIQRLRPFGDKHQVILFFFRVRCVIGAYIVDALSEQKHKKVFSKWTNFLFLGFSLPDA